jgi:O-antigen/teichoic acid export membrane protein
MDEIKRRFGFGRLGHNTVLFASAMGVRAVIQAAYLILLSRWMGPEDYGYFAGSVAAAVILSPLAGWGVSFLVASRVGRDRSSMGSLWATALVQIGFSGLVLVGLVMLASAGWLDQRVSTEAMLMLAVAELVALPVANVAAGLALAADKSVVAAVATSLVPACRLVSALLLVLAGSQSAPDHIAGMHLLGSAVGAMAACALMVRIGARPEWGTRLPLIGSAGVGMSHALATLVGVSYLEIDKVILLQLVDAATAGAYTVAFRAVALLGLPVTALVATSMPRLLAAREGDNKTALHRAISRSVASYALVAIAAALLVAPLLPLVFGAVYADASGYMLALAPWIGFFALHQGLGLRLTTSGWQDARLLIESMGLLLLLPLNLCWIPQLGAFGAVLSLLAAEAAMILAFAWVVARKLR